MDAEAYLAERAALLHPFLDAAVPPADAAPGPLHAAMRHLLFPGGKRLRPGLVFASGEAAGGRAESALPVAAAVELIHTYSLVHDDLPCMDDDAERRGRPTVHVAFGEATAVLAGDALQALAFQVLAGAEALDPPRRAAAVAELAGAAGSRGLVGGQFDDLAFAAGGGDAVERVLSVHARKTAALIAAGVDLGALAAGADAPSRATLRSFGEEVGVAFQIADDLLDEGGDDPCSLVRVLGPGAARERAGHLLESALARIEGLGARAEPLRELARYALRRDR